MSFSAVRKSGRIKTRKKSSLLTDDFEYDETKFDMEEAVNVVEEETKLELDVSSNISDLLNSHSKEKSDEDSQFGRTSFPNLLSKLHKGDHSGESVDIEFEDSNLEYVVCPLCEKHLSTDEDLESHIAEHSKSENGDSEVLSCDICGKVSADIVSYNRHLKSHSGDRPFQCGQCEKSFVDSCSLKRHMKIHDNDRPFSCEICHKAFRDAGSISRHMLTHTERPRAFQCSLCDKNFTDRSGLKRHERTHSGVRPYVCEFCQKAFIDSGSFKRHQKIHIGIRNHHCPRCKRSFMEKQSLVRHQKTVCRPLEGGEDPQDEDPISGNDSYISNTATDIQDKDEDFGVDEESSKDSSNNFSSVNNSFSVPVPPKTLALVKSSGLDSPSNSEVNERKSPTKGTPSLGSLIQKDPKLYDSISEIVDSIDSYEKMLDLCGDRGQKEIDDALKRDPVPMPNNMLCFECGELLVDGVNFKSEGKAFHPSMTNAFKCLNCEEDEDEDDDYGEPPVLMPHYNDVGTEGSIGEDDDKKQIYHGGKEDDESTENFYGSDEPMEQFRERLKNQHGVYFIGDGYRNQSNVNGKGNRSTSSRSASTDSERSRSNTPLMNELAQTHNQDASSSRDSIENDLSLGSVDVTFMQETGESESAAGAKLEYEADDPNIPSVFPCHLCTKVFASSSFLAQHLDLHKKSPHKCMVCGKTFTSGPALKRHMRLHTGEKPYACPICTKQFRDPSNFSKHKKSCFNTNASSVPSPLDSCSTNSGHSSLSVEEQSEKTNSKNKASRKRKKSSKIAVENIKENVMEEPDQSIVFDYDDTRCSEDKPADEEPFPIMTVIPSLDDDDMIEQSADQQTQEDDGNHEIEEENNKDINYIPCEICQKLCESEKHLEKHMIYHNGNPDVTCIECGKSFADPSGMKRHMRIHLGTRPFSCDYCARGYCDNWSLKKHKSKGCLAGEVQVPVDLLHPCPKCTRVFCDTEYLQEHMKMHKGLMKFECDVCKKRFSEAFNLKKHRRLHMAICPGCGLEFRNMKLLTAHQESECSASAPAKEGAETDKSFSCDVCGRVYSTRAYLDRHRKIHSELKPHVCEICNKRFSEAFKLRRHKKASHSNLKPFVCQDCGKCFSDDAALKRHTVSSSCALSKVIGEPVNSETCACQLCDKVFQKNYMLVRHMTVHSQDRPFSCEVCGRSYKDTSSLKRHQMVHQGVKEFICPVCGKDFYYADSLKRHMSGRCGKKTKSRRRKASSTKAKKCYPKNDTGNNYVLNNNNNDDIDDLLTSLTWQDKLYTSPYIPSLIPETSLSFLCRRPTKKALTGKDDESEKWSCDYKRHCWLCDVRAPSTLDLMTHRRIHQHKKRFSCSKCFLRFHSKIYWKAHASTCRNVKAVVGSTKIKLTRKRSAAVMDTSCILPDEIPVDVDDGERKRPRRSVPRAKWSWISQI